MWSQMTQLEPRPLIFSVSVNKSLNLSAAPRGAGDTGVPGTVLLSSETGRGEQTHMAAFGETRITVLLLSCPGPLLRTRL